MKPIPDIANEADMLLRGRRSALWSARGEAIVAIRDAYTALQTVEWEDLALCAGAVKAASERLLQIDSLWRDLK